MSKNLLRSAAVAAALMMSASAGFAGSTGDTASGTPPSSAADPGGTGTTQTNASTAVTTGTDPNEVQMKASGDATSCDMSQANCVPSTGASSGGGMTSSTKVQ
ncbi:hypothetical protein FHS85_001417 [Rhodoligotrophos appendicifer]|uniref:hypothetical protein n=1 Tax=Rhodoligotrophos appendicifer TaxID=987056 RepID=UPI001184E3B9|nr:hypothetical protein [Rhodoligotrophos appendicifer]